MKFEIAAGEGAAGGALLMLYSSRFLYVVARILPENPRTKRGPQANQATKNPPCMRV